MQNLLNKQFSLKTKKILSKILGLNNRTKILTSKNSHKNFIKIFYEKKNFLVFQQKTNNFFSKIKNYKNFRNTLGYPSRGQRTHTNAKTKKFLLKKVLQNK